MKKIIISLTLLLMVTVACSSNEDIVSEEVVETSQGTEGESEGFQEDTEEDTSTEVEEDANVEETSDEEASELQDYIDIELTDIDGNLVHLSDYEGKFIVLNFFGVWCHYCMEEMPSLEKVYSEYEFKSGW